MLFLCGCVQLWVIGGSVSERDEDGQIFNTCCVFNPEAPRTWRGCVALTVLVLQGELVAKHRKVSAHWPTRTGCTVAEG